MSSAQVYSSSSVRDNGSGSGSGSGSSSSSIRKIRSREEMKAPSWSKSSGVSELTPPPPPPHPSRLSTTANKNTTDAYNRRSRSRSPYKQRHQDLKPRDQSRSRLSSRLSSRSRSRSRSRSLSRSVNRRHSRDGGNNFRDSWGESRSDRGRHGGDDENRIYPRPYQHENFQRRPRGAAPPSRVLYCANIARETIAEMLEVTFRKFGSVDRVELVDDRVTKQHKGFGFVYCPSIEEAQKLKDKIQNIVPTFFSIHLLDISITKLIASCLILNDNKPQQQQQQQQ